MSINQLDVVELDDDLSLTGFENRPLRAGSVRYLLDGGYVDQSVGVSGGELVLSADVQGNQIYGSFTLAQVEAINALRASRQVVPFTHHRGSWQVKVIGAEFAQVQEVVNPTSEQLYTGRVTLLIKN